MPVLVRAPKQRLVRLAHPFSEFAPAEADYVIDLGPEGGDKGGNLVAAGTPEEVAKCAASYTGQFLQEKLHMK